MSKEHDLKLSSLFFDDVETGKKPFELRFNDRDYQEGDVLRLREWDGNSYTGRETRKRVTCVLDFCDCCNALTHGSVALGIAPISDGKAEGKVYSIPPLEWQQLRSHDDYWRAETPFGSIHVAKGAEEGRYIASLLLMWHPRDIIGLESLESAKQAAWEAYKAKIEKALEVVE